jgi:hypothetical protein
MANSLAKTTTSGKFNRTDRVNEKNERADMRWNIVNDFLSLLKFSKTKFLKWNSLKHILHIFAAQRRVIMKVDFHFLSHYYLNFAKFPNLFILPISFHFSDVYVKIFYLFQLVHIFSTLRSRTFSICFCCCCLFHFLYFL